MANSIQRIQAAVIDGRSRTPRYIQKQLTTLYDALVQITPAIHRAMIQDTGCSSSEAWFEIYMTLRAVRQEYTAINFHEVIEQEYSVANGKDNVHRRIAFGCAYIIPSQHSCLYSTVQPISAAIAAGNCVVVEIKKTLLRVEELLRVTLAQVMDKDTFMIVNERPKDSDLSASQLVVANAAGERNASVFTLSKQIDSTISRTVAIVDRSANISQAAKDIVRARFRFGGTSPYAPDIVFVNEFALKEFAQAAIRSLTEEMTDITVAKSPIRSQKNVPNGDIHKGAHNSNTTVLVSGSSGRIELAHQRDKATMSKKVQEPVLLINAVTSLDDAIDSANTSQTPLLAAYLFADPKAAKYLSQFISVDSSFTNHIPSQILVGPPAPQGYSISPSARYTKEMFSLPSPEFVTSSAEDKELTEFLEGSSKVVTEKLKVEMKTPLPDMKQPAGGPVGFFEQGIITGLAVEATILVGILGVCARYAVPALLRRF